MMKKEVEQRIIDKATEMGLKAGYSEWNGALTISIDAPTRYTDFRIWEKTDSEKCDWKNGIYAGHFEVEASICRMGGENTPEELSKAAEQIRIAAGFAKVCEELDLSFTEIVKEG